MMLIRLEVPVGVTDFPGWGGSAQFEFVGESWRRGGLDAGVEGEVEVGVEGGMEGAVEGRVGGVEGRVESKPGDNSFCVVGRLWVEEDVFYFEKSDVHPVTRTP